MLFGSEVTHFTRLRACCGCLVYAPIARLMPPSGGALGTSALTLGYRAQPMSATTDWAMPPPLTSSFAALYTYGQLTMKPPVGPWNAERASSSVALDIAGGAAGDRARSPMIRAASA